MMGYRIVCADTMAGDAERGKHIIAAAKSLKRKAMDDSMIASYLYATAFAGRAGLFASALRSAGEISIARAQIFAQGEGFSPLDVRDKLVPWLERSNLLNVKRMQSGKIDRLESLVLTYEPLLEAVAELYESLDPPLEDQGCVQVLEMASEIPRPESEIRHAVALTIGDQPAKRAVELAKSYHVVGHRSGKGLSEPILYSERIWKKLGAKAAQSLSPLKSDERAVLLELVNKVKAHQGIPESLLREDAQKHGAEHMVNFGIGIGLLNRTQIQMADGKQRYFLQTPHFYADMGDQFGEDMCDRVKIFLDSVRNGQHFGRLGTGRVLYPGKLLRKLLNTGEIGPCTAIGTDYVTSERAGIVRVERPNGNVRNSVLKLVQQDTVQKVHDIITTGSMITSSHMTPADVAEGVRFASIEQLRGEAAELPAPAAEAERAVLQKLRESA